MTTPFARCRQFEILVLRCLVWLMPMFAGAQVIVVAHYDFENGLADSTGSQPPLVLQGNATWEQGRLRFEALADKATVNIPNSLLYTSSTAALELDAWIRTDAMLGYGISAATVLGMYNGWNAMLQFTQDKWSASPRALIGQAREPAAAALITPYWDHGISHHLQLVLDATHASLWIDGRLVGKTTATGDLPCWNRTGTSALSMGQFKGVIEELTIKRHLAPPEYADQTDTFSITSSVIESGNQLVVCWNSRPGTQYTVETSPDLVNWTSHPSSVMTASSLRSEVALELPPGQPKLFARVRLGNAFDGQGPLLVSHVDNQPLTGSTTTLKWMPNGTVDEFIVKAGSTLGGAQYFQSPTLPSSSVEFPIEGLPARGETVHITLRYRKGVSWYEKRLTLQAMRSDDLPTEREGLFPIARPLYAGIDQILVLSNRWIIAAVADTQQVAARINTLSGGQFQAQIDSWNRGSPAGNSPSWGAWTALPQIRDTYIAQARTELDETRYTRPDFYALSSPDDARYATATEPLRATQYYVGLNDAETPGMHNLHYAHYCYLEMPAPMESGRHYTVTLDDGKTATFLYDEQRTISRAIKVNQAGYLPDSTKRYAYIGAAVHGMGPLPLQHASTFSVINVATGEVALTGPVTLREANPRFSVKPGSSDNPTTRPLMLGEDLYQIDLNGLTATGNFFISVPGVGRSWTFRHAADAYGEAFYIAARGMYHQRASLAYQMPFTPWQRKKAHTDPIYESALVCFGFGDFDEPSNYQRFDIVGATTDLSRATTNVCGGWYDAADWDRNLRHYTNIFDMLYAYEIAPAKFSDGAMNIPESGNGIPDLLDEAEYGLEVWTRSMTSSGGVSGMVETWTHPSMTDATAAYSYSVRTRWSSLLYAAAAAQLAELLAPIHPDKSAFYRERAELAFSFGNQSSSSLRSITIPAKTNRGSGTPYSYNWTETDEMIRPYQLHARLRLYYLTGNNDYLDNIDNYLVGAIPWQWPNTLKDGVPWFYFPVAHRGAGIFSQATIDTWRAKFIDGASGLAAQLEGMPYRHTWPRYQDYWMAWGESNMANRGRVLLQAYALTQNPVFRDTALANLDYMFGSNAMGMSWTTGIGFTYPAVLQHEVSDTDGIDDPVPGLSVYGIDGGPMHHTLRNNVWSSPSNAANSSQQVFFADPGAPFYRRWTPHPTANTGQCEFTVHETMSAVLFNCAMLLPDGWQPSAALKNRKPRHKDSLFGYWLLP